MHETPAMPAQRGAWEQHTPRATRAHLRLLPPVGPIDAKTPVSRVFLDDRRERTAAQPVTGVDRIRMLAWCVRIVLPAIVAHRFVRPRHALIV